MNFVSSPRSILGTQLDRVGDILPADYNLNVKLMTFLELTSHFLSSDYRFFLMTVIAVLLPFGKLQQVRMPINPISLKVPGIGIHHFDGKLLEMELSTRGTKAFQ